MPRSADGIRGAGTPFRPNPTLGLVAPDDTWHFAVRRPDGVSVLHEATDPRLADVIATFAARPLLSLRELEGMQEVAQSSRHVWGLRLLIALSVFALTPDIGLPYRPGDSDTGL